MKQISAADYNNLKNNFINDLIKKDKTKFDETYAFEIEENFFMYADEFEKYAKKELDIKFSNFENNIEKLTNKENLEILLELINKEEEEMEKINSEELEDTELNEELNADTETKDKYEELNEENEINLLNATIADMFKNEDFKNIVDADSDGKISEEELLAMINTAKENDHDENDLSFSDLADVMAKTAENKFEIKTNDVIEESIQPEEMSTPLTQGQAGSWGGSSSGAANYSTGAGTSQQAQTKEPSVDELQTIVTEKETALAEKQEAITNIQNDSNEDLKNLKEETDSAFEAYTTKLKEVDADKANKLIELTETKEKIENNKTEISNQELTISNCDSTLSNINSRKSTLEGQKSELEAAKNSQDTPQEQKDAIDAQLNALEAELTELTKQEEEVTKQKTQAQEKKTELEEKNQELTEKYGNIDEEISRLEEEISKIENDDLQQAKSDYESKKAEYENAKNTALEKAQAEAQELTQQLNEARAKLTEAQNKEAEKLYSPKTGAEGAVDWAREYDDMSQSEMAKVFKEKGYAFHSGVWCADFVRMALGEGAGDKNLPDWYNNIDNKAYCPNIQNAGKDHRIKAEEAKTGDIVLFDWDNDNVADHVGLFVDNGNGNTTITTIEGNTKNSTIGSNSAVEEKERSRSSVLGIYDMTA